MKLCLHRKGHLWRDAKPLTTDQQKLVEDNISLAYHFAKRKPMAGVDRDENESEALFVLSKAAAGFNPDLGWKFTTYAWTVWINYRKHANREIHLEHKGYQAKLCRLGQENMGHMEPFDKGMDPAIAAELADETAHKLGAFAVLDARARRVLELRAEGFTLSQVGQEIGVTRERVRQIEKNGIYKVQYSQGENINTQNSIIRKLHAARTKRLQQCAQYRLKVAAIKQAKADHPEWELGQIAEATGTTLKMCRKHTGFSEKDVRRRLVRGKPPERISLKTGIPLDEILAIEAKIKRRSA